MPRSVQTMNSLALLSRANLSMPEVLSIASARSQNVHRALGVGDDQRVGMRLFRLDHVRREDSMVCRAIAAIGDDLLAGFGSDIRAQRLIRHEQHRVRIQRFHNPDGIRMTCSRCRFRP